MDPNSLSQAANPAPAPIPLGYAAGEAPVLGRDRRTVARTEEVRRSERQREASVLAPGKSWRDPRLNRDSERLIGPTRGAPANTGSISAGWGSTLLRAQRRSHRWSAFPGLC